jgi:hypothetical protein
MTVDLDGAILENRCALPLLPPLLKGDLAKTLTISLPATFFSSRFSPSPSPAQSH